MPKEELKTSYTAAMQRLLQIVEQIENSEIDVDSLDAAVKEAVNLIQYCRKKLAGTEAVVQEAFNQLNERQN